MPAQIPCDLFIYTHSTKIWRTRTKRKIGYPLFFRQFVKKQQRYRGELGRTQRNSISSVRKSFYDVRYPKQRRVQFFLGFKASSSAMRFLWRSMIFLWVSAWFSWCSISRWIWLLRFLICSRCWKNLRNKKIHTNAYQLVKVLFFVCSFQLSECASRTTNRSSTATWKQNELVTSLL